jgi:hypothetical protein
MLENKPKKKESQRGRHDEGQRKTQLLKERIAQEAQVREKKRTDIQTWIQETKRKQSS